MSGDQNNIEYKMLIAKVAYKINVVLNDHEYK